MLVWLLALLLLTLSIYVVYGITLSPKIEKEVTPDHHYILKI